MNATDLLAASRGAERLLIVVCCGMSVFFGYSLFKVGILAEQKGIISVGAWKVRLEKVGPGIFFALFGMIGLTFSTSQIFKINGTTYLAKPEANSTQTAYLGSGDIDLQRRKIRALNHVIDPIMDGQNINFEALKNTLARDKAYFQATRRQLLEAIFSKEDIDLWFKNVEEYHAGHIASPQVEDRLNNIQPYMEGAN